MKKKVLVISLLFLSTVAFSQKYFTRTGNIRFFSSTPVEDIEAKTNQGSCVLDTETGEVVAKVLIKSFEFEKALMQEHFNENYMESDKFPKAVLTAKIDNLSEIDFGKTGVYEVKLKGELDMHGVKKERTLKGELEVMDDIVNTKVVFIIKPEDHDIKIPKMVQNKIAKEIEVTVFLEMSELKR